ncbi:hypothetical protein DYST_03985 [Dyella terrae]|nr:hypothetical protein DYST_03985 [Dyella terrae]
MVAVGLWGPDGQGNDGGVKLRCRMQCAAVRPVDMTKTAQYGPVFSQQRPPMERGRPPEGDSDAG